MKSRSKLLLVCLVPVSLLIYAVGYHHHLAIRVLSRSVSEKGGDETYSKRLLSIHLVVVPFMNYTSSSSKKLAQREQEYRFVMQNNLAHPLVEYVHVLTTNSTETLQRFSGIPNREKMLVSEVDSIHLFRYPFEYISTNLVGKDVMFANADIYLGQHGFDKVDAGTMVRENVMYALSRRVAPEDRCGRTKDGRKKSVGITDMDICLSGKYFGSHDAFLFRLHKPLPEDILEELEFALGSLGQENILIWQFQTRLKYCVLNPCSILPVFHYHCSSLRNRGNKVRVNSENNTGRAPYTNKLLCHD